MLNSKRVKFFSSVFQQNATFHRINSFNIRLNLTQISHSASLCVNKHHPSISEQIVMLWLTSRWCMWKANRIIPKGSVHNWALLAQLLELKRSPWSYTLLYMLNLYLSRYNVLTFAFTWYLKTPEGKLWYITIFDSVCLQICITILWQ